MRFRELFLNNDNGLRGRLITKTILPDFKAENDAMLKNAEDLSGPVTSYTLSQEELKRYRGGSRKGLEGKKN